MDSTQIFAAEYLFDGYTMHRNMGIEIESDGTILGLTKMNNSQSILPGLIVPAFINTHCHLELSHLKGQIPKHTGLIDFLLQINALRFTRSKQDILSHMKDAEEAMLRAGTAAVGDISNQTDSLDIKMSKRLLYHTFVETFGLSDEKSLARFSDSLAIYHSFHAHMPCSLVLHAPYSISESLIKLCDDFNRNKISTFHNQESDAENEFIQFGQGDFLRLTQKIVPEFAPTPKGVRSLKYMLQKLDHTQHLILVHNTATLAEDVHDAKQYQKILYWCLCPNANRFIENKLPNIPMLIEEGCKLTLGTDSLASNDGLSIWNELCTIKYKYPDIDWQTMLPWATINGAQALNMDQQLGSFEKGKKPGIIHLPDFKDDELPQFNTKTNWLAPF